MKNIVDQMISHNNGAEPEQESTHERRGRTAKYIGSLLLLASVSVVGVSKAGEIANVTEPILIDTVGAIMPDFDFSHVGDDIIKHRRPIN